MKMITWISGRRCLVFYILLNGCLYTAEVSGQSATIKPLLSAFDGKNVTLQRSWIKQREELNTAYLYNLSADRLLHNFRINAGIASNATPLEGWESPQIGLRGHFTGHYLSACASIIGNYGDTVLLKRINYMVDALETCQQKLGGTYLSAFPEGEFETLELKYGEVWAPYYTYHKIMQGLLDVYLITGNRKAYTILCNMASYVEARMSRISDATIEKMLYTAAANPPNEAGAMSEVLQHLFAVSGDSSHLTLAKVFDRIWFSKPLAENKDILSGLHSNTHLVMVNGFAARFENTHEDYFRKASLNFWNMLQDHSFVNGSSSGPRPIASTLTSQTAEHWGVAGRLSSTLTSEIAESCVTHNTQKLTSTLLRWTASAEYAEAYMNTFYNAVMALQSESTGLTVYHLPLGSPEKKKFLKENDFKCCSGSGVEAFTRLNSTIYFHNADNVWINLYVPSRLDWKEKKISISQISSFPEERNVELIVDAGGVKNFGVNLFIPSWAGPQTKILVNGTATESVIRPLTYLNISRRWKKGDRIEIDFQYNYRVNVMPDDDRVIALFYGPLLLAFETEHELILKGTRDDVLNGLVKKGNEFTFELRNNGNVYRLIPFYKINTQSYGVYATIRNDY